MWTFKQYQSVHDLYFSEILIHLLVSVTDINEVMTEFMKFPVINCSRNHRIALSCFKTNKQLLPKATNLFTALSKSFYMRRITYNSIYNNRITKFESENKSEPFLDSATSKSMEKKHY